MSGGERVYQVAEITQLVKATLEASFPSLVIEGEVSNFRASGAGHWYFSLKDQDAMIQAVMFRGRSSRVSFAPEDGMLVRARGSISVYPRRGAYQIIVEELQLAGMGQILAMLEKRKRALAAEGLFDEGRKKPLPAYPERIAVVTSASGAAIRDFVQVLGRRNAGIDVVVLPAPVQGAEAAGRIAAQLRRADRLKLGDVIVLTRGGGSIEDLLPFSEELVVRAVAETETPVISAVGHEIDTSLSDLAADLRAPTPSAAAELVSAQQVELRQRILEQGRTMIYALSSMVRRARSASRQFSPDSLLKTFRHVLDPYLMRVDDARDNLAYSTRMLLRDRRAGLTTLRDSLEAMSPRKVLERGYAIARKSGDGRVISRADEAEAGEDIRVVFADSSLEAQVTTQIEKGL